MKLYTVVKETLEEGKQYWNFSRSHWVKTFTENCVSASWDKASKVAKYQATKNFDIFEDIKLATYGVKNTKRVEDD